MKNALGHIDRWLDGVKADRRHLKAGSTCVVIAQQLSRKTNGSEFRKTGRLVTWQAIPTLAAATGLSERMVRYAVRRLEAAGHLTIKTGRGPGRSNHYTLIEKRHQSAAIDEANSGTQVPHLAKQVRHLDAPNAAAGFTDCGTQVPPNPSITSQRTLTPPTETEPGGPRQRADALGPLGVLEATLRQSLGPRFKYLAMARLVPTTAGAVKLSVMTDEARVLIRRNCEAEILAASGASYLEFDVELSADPPKARRQP